MLNIIKNFIKVNKEAILICMFVLTIIIVINSIIFLAIVVSIILSYFLYFFKRLVMYLGCPKEISFSITYLTFVGICILIASFYLPKIFGQAIILLNDLPFMVQKGNFLAIRLIKQYPFLFPNIEANLLFSNAIVYIQAIGKIIITASLLSIYFLFKWTLCLILTPILMFFFLKDYNLLYNWFKNIMPEKSIVCKDVWNLINKHINNYIRGKLVEAFIMFIANYILFKTYEIAYAGIFAFIVGLSVTIPYLGAIIVSIPIIILSSVQLGLSKNLLNLATIYTVIQLLDGNLLVPLLFAEAVKLHPLAIVIAIVFFGSTLGLYGAIFAIPFAIIAKAIIDIYLTPK